MTAGLNLLGRVWDYRYDLGDGDDEIGGAVPSGTVVHEQIQLRVQAAKPTQALVEQGVETINFYAGLLFPVNLNIENNNEIEITAPISSHYYGDRFRMIGDPQRPSVSGQGNRGYLLVNLRRIEQGRTIQ